MYNFKFKLEEVKYKIFIYDSEHQELLLKLVNEYWNMVEKNEIFAGDMTIIFDLFRTYLREPAFVDWDIIVQDKTLDKVRLEVSRREFLKKIIGEDTEEDFKN